MDFKAFADAFIDIFCPESEGGDELPTLDEWKEYYSDAGHPGRKAVWATIEWQYKDIMRLFESHDGFDEVIGDVYDEIEALIFACHALGFTPLFKENGVKDVFAFLDFYQTMTHDGPDGPYSKAVKSNLIHYLEIAKRKRGDKAKLIMDEGLRRMLYLLRTKKYAESGKEVIDLPPLRMDASALERNTEMFLAEVLNPLSFIANLATTI